MDIKTVKIVICLKIVTRIILERQRFASKQLMVLIIMVLCYIMIAEDSFVGEKNKGKISEGEKCQSL